MSDITHLITTIANRVTNNVVRSAYCNNPPGGHNLCAKKITDARIGERRRQDAAISIALMIELQSRLEARWLEVNEENNWQEKRKAAENGAFFVWTYCGSLRGFETPKVLLHDLRQQIVSPRGQRV
jgi:hypothetical protein